MHGTKDYREGCKGHGKDYREGCKGHIAAIKLEIQIAKIAPRKVNFTYKVKNVGTRNLCHEIVICSKIFGKFNLDKDSFGSENTGSKVMSIPEDFNEQRIYEDAIARVDDVESRCQKDFPYFRNLVRYTSGVNMAATEFHFYAHPYNDDVVKEAWFVMYYIDGFRRTVSFIDPGDALKGNVVTDDPRFSHKFPLVDLPPGKNVYFTAMLVSLPLVSDKVTFARYNVVSDVTDISGTWFVSSDFTRLTS